MNRRQFLAAASSSLTAATLLHAPARAAAPQRPNIVLIMADDLGYGHLGCYGQQIIQTPHLDRMAAEGMRFTQAYAGCALCAPSRSTLMTGLHNGHTPVRGNSGGIPLRDEDLTFAEVLQQAGYNTGLFGKWGLGEHTTTGVPNRQGFDEFFGTLHQKHAHFYYTDYLWHNDERFPLPGNHHGKREQYTHDVCLDRALEFIRQPRQEPFFCFISTTIPHHEWVAPPEALEQYSGKFDEERPQFRWREGYALPEEPKANMAAMISHMDRGVGRVLQLLEEQGLDENTLVLFTSDNGADRYSLACPEFFQANGPLRDYKGTLYEGGIRVPLIARWPGVITAGAESGHVCYQGDMFTTFSELAGATDQIPEDLDSLSIVPTLTGGEQPQHDALYWETEGSRAARRGPWKAVQPKPDAEVELYNLDEDLSETNNIAASHPDLVASLAAYLQQSHVEPPPQVEPTAPDGRQYF